MGCGSSQSGQTQPDHALPHPRQPFSSSEDNRDKLCTPIHIQETLHVSRGNTTDEATVGRTADPKERNPEINSSAGEDSKLREEIPNEETNHREEIPNEETKHCEDIPNEETKHREDIPNEVEPTTATTPTTDAGPTGSSGSLVTESDMPRQEEIRGNDSLDKNQEPRVIPELQYGDSSKQAMVDVAEHSENPRSEIQERGQNDQEVLGSSGNTATIVASSPTIGEPGSSKEHDNDTPVSIDTKDNDNDDGDWTDERGSEHQEMSVSIDDIKQGLLYGDASVQCPKTAKIVRIFISSTFTDTTQERNCLLERSYPRLKAVCKKKGYEFQLVDMRWGVGQGIANDHMTSDMCFREIKLCQQLSTGPNFVTLLSHKYGYYAYPRQIEAQLYRQLIATVTSEENKALMEKQVVH
ncbi:uncharacterized protein LOC124282208 [Haliotis rubra]|uniref:uncharacterized protein LOC124282208 n=1 Tax=Haliotis rubra TaxID=36100 RepID=UPI001EE5B35F|nr:uncharacterized protein LOC124282208 [Haliotis rubra]